jgi:hypothetical protein
MSDRVQHVQGLRRSGAAGPHGSERTRAEELAEALADYEDEIDDEEEDR